VRSSGESPPAPAAGWNVVHLFAKVRPENASSGALGEEAIERARKSGQQVVTASILGHKADFCVMGLGPDIVELGALKTGLERAGFEIAYSYVSLTEVSEYAAGVPEEMKMARLYPELPPEGLPWFCFYPMSKRRAAGAENWYTLDYEERLSLMHGHGSVGRQFRGRVLQLVTGSTGLDDYEWGVTLFAARPDDLKECVYTMRFDRASALYADFGPFYSGYVGDAEQVLSDAGVPPR
jgi:chlorite dismutase